MSRLPIEPACCFRLSWIKLRSRIMSRREQCESSNGGGLVGIRSQARNLPHCHGIAIHGTSRSRRARSARAQSAGSLPKYKFSTNAAAVCFRRPCDVVDCVPPDEGTPNDRRRSRQRSSPSLTLGLFSSARRFRPKAGFCPWVKTQDFGLAGRLRKIPGLSGLSSSCVRPCRLADLVSRGKEFGGSTPAASAEPAQADTPPLLPPDEPEPDVIGALERLDHRAGTTAARNERTRWLRPFGVFGRLVTYAVLFLCFTLIGLPTSRTSRLQA